jgi:phosphoribosylamine--glycine ligase
VRLLLVGSGGREHALAWKLKQDDPEIEIIATPGNPGIASLARCVQIRPTDVAELAELARTSRVDIALIGPEAPLAAGIVDRFTEVGIPTFGPTRAAAEIETSKSFAKRLMRDAGVPTARAEMHRDPQAAKSAIRRFGAPVVIKASGLAAGKGVVVARSMEEADAAVDMMLREHRLGDAGSEVLVEEYMDGEELSVFAISDGDRYVTMLPAQDHKPIGTGDLGPNTGGMGAYAPVSVGTRETLDMVRRSVFDPVLRAMREQGRPFRGLLYAGLMLTPTGPKVVEFNCRFGDPETEAILPLMRSSLLDIVARVARGATLADVPDIVWASNFAVTTVVAAPGYPDKPSVGHEIVLPAEREDVLVFHAGTDIDQSGTLRSAGGRVLAITATAPTLAGAHRLSLEHAQQVQLDGKQLRTDIGWRDLRRNA